MRAHPIPHRTSPFAPGDLPSVLDLRAATLGEIRLDMPAGLAQALEDESAQGSEFDQAWAERRLALAGLSLGDRRAVLQALPREQRRWVRDDTANWYGWQASTPNYFAMASATTPAGVVLAFERTMSRFLLEAYTTDALIAGVTAGGGIEPVALDAARRWLMAGALPDCAFVTLRRLAMRIPPVHLSQGLPYTGKPDWSIAGFVGLSDQVWQIITPPWRQRGVIARRLDEPLRPRMLALCDLMEKAALESALEAATIHVSSRRL